MNLSRFIEVIVKLGFEKARKYFLVGIVLSSAYIIFNSAVPYLLQKWINLFVERGNHGIVIKFGLLFIFAMIFAVVLDYFGAYVLIQLREKLRYSMRKNLIKEIITSKKTWSAEKQSGYYTQILMNDVEKFSGVVVSFVYMILPAVIGLPAAVFFASLISPLFTIAGAIGFLLLLAVIYTSGRHLRVLSGERQEAYAQLGDRINELINSSLMIKIFDAMNPILLHNERYFKELKDTSVNKNSYGYFVQVISEFIRNTIEIVSVLFALLFANSLNLTGASMMAGVVYLSRIWQPTVLMEEINEELQTSFASAERIYEVILKKTPQNITRENFINTISKIELKDVSLFYGKKPIAKNINLSAENGKCIGIMGGSGIGKTTLAKTILGLHEEFTGTILINGKLRLNEIANVYKRIGYLSQFVPILTDTLSFNIALSNDFNGERLTFAINKSGLKGFFEKLPHGFQTVISEKTISGGERKRIGIARLLYREKDVLIFDEPFSGIDSGTVKEIYNEITKNFKNKILFIISHNEHYLEACDKIVVLK